MKRQPRTETERTGHLRANSVLAQLQSWNSLHMIQRCLYVRPSVLLYYTFILSVYPPANAHGPPPRPTLPQNSPPSRSNPRISNLSSTSIRLCPPPPLRIHPTAPSPSLLEARKHLERAAFLHFAPAQYKLGHAYEFAEPPFPFDPLLSVQYYSLASQQGEVDPIWPSPSGSYAVQEPKSA